MIFFFFWLNRDIPYLRGVQEVEIVGEPPYMSQGQLPDTKLSLKQPQQKKRQTTEFGQPPPSGQPGTPQSKVLQPSKPKYNPTNNKQKNAVKNLSRRSRMGMTAATAWDVVN